MKLQIDTLADALHLRLNDSRVLDSERVAPDVVLDYNDEGQVVGVEILNLSKRTGKADLQRLVFETTGNLPVAGVGEKTPKYGKPKP